MTSSRFRLDNTVLAFRFTATAIDRSSSGQARELLESPADLEEWLDLHDLEVVDVTGLDLAAARELREAVHRVGSCVAARRTPSKKDTDLINDASRSGRARLQMDRRLTSTWFVPDSRLTVTDALGILAQDAIEQFTQRGDRVKACEDPACRGLFLDTSRAGIRRWCSMNYCGNRNKKLKFRHGARTL